MRGGVDPGRGLPLDVLGLYQQPVFAPSTVEFLVDAAETAEDQIPPLGELGRGQVAKIDGHGLFSAKRFVYRIGAC